MERSMFIPRHLLIMAIGIAVASVSCKKDDFKKITGTENSQLNKELIDDSEAPSTEDLSAFMYLDAMDGLSAEASEETDMNLLGDEGIPTAILNDPFEAELSTRSKGSDDLNDDHSFRNNGAKKCHFPERIKLSERQKEALRKAYKEFQECKRNVEIALRKRNKEILEKARLHRAKLIDAVKSGRITREEFVKAMRQLNERTQNALKNNPSREELAKKLRRCHLGYLDSVKNILTKEQWKYFGKCYRLHFKNHR